jgi:hypothetical protein
MRGRENILLLRNAEMTVLEEANNLLQTPMASRSMDDLSEMSIVKSKISQLIPKAKHLLKNKELEADDAEKSYIIESRTSGVKMNIEQMKAEARLLKNKLLLEANELELNYFTLYQFYQELADQVVSTRLFLKL